MNEIEVSSIDLVEGGNVFKQGHYLTLGYIPRDESGAVVDLTGKTLSVTLWGRKGIGFEAEAVYADGVLRFTLNETIPAGEYNVEFTATSSTDATYRKKFPTSASSGRIVVRQSADDLGATGVQVYTVAQLKAEQQALQTNYEQTVDGKIAEVEATVTAGIGAFTEDTEVLLARMGEPSLLAYNQKTAASLADKVGGGRKAEPEDLSATTLGLVTGTGGPINLLSIPQDKSVHRGKTSFLTSENRFVYETLTPGVTINTTTGNVTAVTGRSASSMIPVTAGESISLNDGSDTIAYYNTAGTFVSGVRNTKLPITITPAQSGFIRIVFFDEFAENFTVASGSQSKSIGRAVKFSVPFANSFGTDNIDDNSVTTEKTDFIEKSKNKFDYAARSVDFYFAAANTGYDTTDFIYFPASADIAINKARRIELYDNNKVFLTMIDNSTRLPITFKTAVNGYIRAAAIKADIETLQVEEGTVSTSFVPFGVKIGNLLIEENTVTESALEDGLKAKINSIEAMGAGDLKVIKEGENFTLVSDFDGTNEIKINTVRNGSANGSFSFGTTFVGSDYIHGAGDDVTPIRTFTTLGANHGYANISAYTVVGHDKTAADLGSRWTDGTTVFTLIKIDGNVLTFAPPYSVDTNGIVTSSGTVPATNLTHSSGATHTATVSIANRIAGAQLYPSVKNVNVAYVLDGNEITADGTYYGSELQVRESYDIIDYKSLVDVAQANIGVSYLQNAESIVGLSNTFLFTKGLRCTVSAGMKVYKKASFINCGFLQSVVPVLAGHTVKRYMPNVKPKNGFDFANGIDMASYSVNTYIEPADLVNPAIPPNHYTDWLIDGSGNRKYGFSLGYVVDKTNSKNADRLANTTHTWDLRSTKKSYPNAIGNNIVLEAGSYMTFEGFRNYISPQQVGEATSVNIVKDKKDTYVYVTFNQQVANADIPLPDDLGKGISLIQGENLTLQNNVADANGVVVKTSSALGNAVLKLN